MHHVWREAATDFGSRTSLQLSVSLPIISSSGAELALVKYLSMKFPIFLFSSSKRFPEIDEFSSETSRFAMTMCRSSQTTQRVHLTRDREKHASEGPCLPFGESANIFQPSCGTITKSIFILGF